MIKEKSGIGDEVVVKIERVNKPKPEATDEKNDSDKER